MWTFWSLHFNPSKTQLINFFVFKFLSIVLLRTPDQGKADRKSQVRGRNPSNKQQHAGPNSEQYLRD